jgi:hypothetical protein
VTDATRARRPAARWLRALLLPVVMTVAAGALLFHNTAAARTDDLWNLPSSWRFWDDVTIAIGRYLEWRSPDRRLEDPRADLPRATRAYQHFLRKEMKDRTIAPWQFWRTVPADRFAQNPRRYAVPPLEDAGRARLLAAGYVLLGGIAPYLPLWLGMLLCWPLMLWFAMEACRAGHAGAAATALLLAASSPYLAESLSLPHSPVGFYLLAVFALAALTLYAVLGRSVSRSGFWTRFALASALFALCTVCRSGTIFLLPGFVLALHFAARRVFGQRSPEYRLRFAPGAHALLRTAVLGALFLVPYLAVRPAAHHNVWLSLWEGLGDYGASRGFSWYDDDARRFLVAQGVTPFADPKDVMPVHERVFRRSFFSAVREDPAWYVGVLFRRVLATISLSKLEPWGPLDGYSRERPYFHYKYTTPIDWLGVGSTHVELPVPALWTPTFALAFVWMSARRRPGAQPLVERIEAQGRVLLCLATATLPLPVLLSTASGLETQAFGAVYLLGLAFLVQEGLRLLWVRARGRA